MITASLSLFGLDVFAPFRRPAESSGSDENTISSRTDKNRPEQLDDRETDREFSENFYWGIHPF